MQTLVLEITKATTTGINHVKNVINTQSKSLLILLLLTLVPIQGFSQNKTSYDSLDIRIYNKGKHYLKEYTITINGHNYTFKDVWKYKQSSYIKAPYLWTNNQTKTTVVIKRIVKYDEWMTVLQFPIDNISEHKFIKGKYTIEITTKKKKGNLEVKENIKKEE